MIVSVDPIAPELCRKIERETGETIQAFSNMQQAAEALPQAEIAITLLHFNEEALSRASRLKWLFSMSAGVNTLPLAAIAGRGVVVTNARGIHGSQMSEQALGTMILFSRRLRRCLDNQRAKIWDRTLGFDELDGKTLCIVGAGTIGRETARKAKVFGMRVLGLKVHAAPLPDFDEVWGMDRLHEALSLADYVLLLTPLTDETYHLFGEAEFAAVKQGGVFLNYSRGDTVDEAALLGALRTGHLGGAGLDVFHEEPLGRKSPFWEMENVVVTPHSAGLTPRYFARAVDLFIKSCLLYRRGEPLPNIVDASRRY